MVIFFGSVALIVGAFLFYYFVFNDAPIIHGKVLKNVVYKDGQTLDIYLPTEAVETSPIVLYFHGGAWIGGTKRSVNFNRFNGAFNRLRAEGYTIVSPSYTVAKKNKSPFPQCIIDAFDAIKWVQDHASDYNLDLDRFGVFGESAGGHIAMMVTYCDPKQFDLNHSFKMPNYLIDVYGPSDLEKVYLTQTVDSLNAILDRLPDRLSEELDISKRLFGFDPKEESERAKAFMAQYSPMTYVSKEGPPVLMIHGEKDQVVPFDQSVVLKSKLDSMGTENQLHGLSGVNHGFIGADKSQKENIQKWIVDFVLNH